MAHGTDGSRAAAGQRAAVRSESVGRAIESVGKGIASRYRVNRTTSPFTPLAMAWLLAATATVATQDTRPDEARFRGGVDLIHVSATVTDGDGRFVSDLQASDFTILEDGIRQNITYFSNERVPVSLGILLDASGSMTREKMSAALSAINRFVFELLGPEDELFFAEFANAPRLSQSWTQDKGAISRAVREVSPGGGTALYDAIAEALPVAETGRHRKKALLVISDGNDTNSEIPPGQLRTRIRDSDVLVYALGIDGTARPITASPTRPPFRLPGPPAFPRLPGRGRPRFPQILGGGAGWPQPSGARVNADALRDLTDDTGGRTEIVRGVRGLDAATARIADELSRQYSLAYTSSQERDGRWHAIQVELRNRRLNVRARRGYTAS